MPLLEQTKRAISGVAGEACAFQSRLQVIFMSDHASDILVLNDVPVMVVEGFPDIILGRKGVFDLFTIIFEESKRAITIQTK